MSTVPTSSYLLDELATLFAGAPTPADSFGTLQTLEARMHKGITEIMRSFVYKEGSPFCPELAFNFTEIAS